MKDYTQTISSTPVGFLAKVYCGDRYLGQFLADFEGDAVQMAKIFISAMKMVDAIKG